ncbi:MAG: CoA pyrophosphatase, partial [Ideonella sp.]
MKRAIPLDSRMLEPMRRGQSVKFAPDLRISLRARLEAFVPLLAPLADTPEQRRAAVALAVTEAGFGAGLPGLPTQAAWSDDAALVLTRRAASLRKHGGQWALPGGRIDPGESAEQTALRELAEEVDLHLGIESVLGRLDDYATRSGFVITPVVVWAGRADQMRINEAEVASIHRIGLDEFLRSDAPILEPSRHGPQS